MSLRIPRSFLCGRLLILPFQGLQLAMSGSCSFRSGRHDALAPDQRRDHCGEFEEAFRLRLDFHLYWPRFDLRQPLQAHEIFHSKGNRPLSGSRKHSLRSNFYHISMHFKNAVNVI